MDGRIPGATGLRRAVLRGIAVAGFGGALWLAGQLTATASADEPPAPGLLGGTLSAVAEVPGTLVGTVGDTLPPVADLVPGAVRPVVTDVVAPVVDAVTRPVLGALDRTPLPPVVDTVVRPVPGTGTAVPGVPMLPEVSAEPVVLPPAPAATHAPAVPVPAAAVAAPGAAPAALPAALPASAAATAAVDLPGDASDPASPLPPASPSALPPAGSGSSSAGAGAGTDLPPAVVLATGAIPLGSPLGGAADDRTPPSLDAAEDPATAPD